MKKWMRHCVRQNLLPFRSASFISPWLKLPSPKNKSYKNRNEILMWKFTFSSFRLLLGAIFYTYLPTFGRNILSLSVVKSTEEITFFPEVGNSTKLHGVTADATVLQCIPTHTLSHLPDQGILLGLLDTWKWNRWVRCAGNKITTKSA